MELGLSKYLIYLLVREQFKLPTRNPGYVGTAVQFLAVPNDLAIQGT